MADRIKGEGDRTTGPESDEPIRGRDTREDREDAEDSGQDDLDDDGDDDDDEEEGIF